MWTTREHVDKEHKGDVCKSFTAASFKYSERIFCAENRVKNGLTSLLCVCVCFLTERFLKHCGGRNVCAEKNFVVFLVKPKDLRF